jgi:hypothetical protein
MVVRRPVSPHTDISGSVTWFSPIIFLIGKPGRIQTVYLVVQKVQRFPFIVRLLPYIADALVGYNYCLLMGSFGFVCRQTPLSKPNGCLNAYVRHRTDNSWFLG